MGTTTVFVYTRLWKTKHPRKRFQNFRQSCVLLTDRIEIHQLQPLVWPFNLLYATLSVFCFPKSRINENGVVSSCEIKTWKQFRLERDSMMKSIIWICERSCNYLNRRERCGNITDHRNLSDIIGNNFNQVPAEKVSDINWNNFN